MGKNFCHFLFPFLHSKPYLFIYRIIQAGYILKGIYSKTKEFASFGGTFFYFRVNPSRKDSVNHFERVASP